MNLKKLNKKKIAKKSKITTLPEYEKIGRLTIKLERWSWRSFDFAILLFSMFLYMAIAIEINPPTTYIEAFRTLMLLSFLMPGMILFIIWIIFMIVGASYEKIKTYNINNIIKQYFNELSKKPDEKKRNEILKHLTYNLSRIKNPFFAKFFIFIKPPSISKYIDFRTKDNKLKIEIIDRTLSLVHNSILHWKNHDIKDLYRKIGNHFENEDYLGLMKILNDNKNKFTDFDEIESEMESRAMSNKLKLFGKGFVAHARDIMYFLFIVAFLMYLFGVISSPIQFPF